MATENSLWYMKSDNLENSPKYVIGICAMDNKARSKPMRNILNRLLSTGEFQIVIFGDKVILDESIESWPICDFLISFFSKGFPLQKAIDYVNLRKPYCINDLEMQRLLLDRRLVLKLLDAIHASSPKRLFVDNNHSEWVPDSLIEKVKERMGIDLYAPEFKTNGKIIQIDADTISLDGKILKKPFVEKPICGEDHNIYIYYPQSTGGGVRKLFRKVGNKSSEFCPTITNIRTDAEYIYEEFMKVDNCEDVKVYTIGENYAHAETRKSPVVDGVVCRNAEGKEVRYVTALSEEEKMFANNVCTAFLQAVCGFDLLRVRGKSYVIDVNGWSFVKGNDEYYDNCARILRNLFLEYATQRNIKSSVVKEQNFDTRWRLKGFISVFRHGDRTPKQKMKFQFRSKPFVDLLKGSKDEIILRNPDQLKEVVKAANEAYELKCEDLALLEQLKYILYKKSKLPGTKVQLKPSYNKETGDLKKFQLIVKWGGEFTHAGRHHSRDLGENLNKDITIMNPKCLDNVKMYSSSERRVVATADIFSKAFLKVSELPKDFLIISKEMLDDTNAAKEQMESVKTKLQDIFNPKQGFSCPSSFILPKNMEDPPVLVQDTIDLLCSLREVMNENFRTLDVDKLQSRWCCSESPDLFKERWEKLFHEFCDTYNRKNVFDTSKISELYDSLKYDALHNRDFLEGIFSSPKYGRDLLRQLYRKAKVLFDFVAPHEYGIEDSEKLEIGLLNSKPLLLKILGHIQEVKSSPTPCARLFFTKESKVICLLNIILLSELPTSVDKADTDELDYLTQITFEIYERSKNVGPDQYISEYSMRVSFSPGAHDSNLIDLQIDGKHSISVAPRKFITDHVSLDFGIKAL
ncbi:hypothetical protein BCR36DRAFT_340296, partial [Piromyces finnis]